jgi:hypothetical protein
MTFFLNNQPPEPDAPEPYADDESTPHSARIRPLFKQDPGLTESLPGQHMSLSAYISKHLQETEQAAAPPEPALPESGFRFITTTSSQSATPDSQLPQGQYLNSLDVELAAGLEQYLPTPLFRMRVMKKRLDADIAELKMRLNKYERLPEQSPELRGRISAVRARLATLEAHERQVSQDLAAALAFGPLLFGLSRQSQGVSDWLDAGFSWFRRILTRIFYGRVYLDVEAAGQELRSLQELFADRIHDKTASSAELSQILNRYEQTAHEMEALAQQLKTGSLSARLWQEARRLVK